MAICHAAGNGGYIGSHCPKSCARHISIPTPFFLRENAFDVDYAEVCGQENAKRALEIAAAGGHNLIMVGPPGSGKTMLAKRLPTVLTI